MTWEMFPDSNSILNDAELSSIMQTSIAETCSPTPLPSSQGAICALPFSVPSLNNEPYDEVSYILPLVFCLLSSKPRLSSDVFFLLSPVLPLPVFILLSSKSR